MKRPAFLLTALFVVLGCAVSIDAQPTAATPDRTRAQRREPAPPPQYPRVEYDADLRPFMFTGGLTNKAGRLYGEHPGWAIGDPGVIYDHLNAGLDRTILRQPVGPGRIGWVLFSSWHPLNDAQKLDFRNGVLQWKGEQYGRRVGVFFGRDATDPFIRRDAGISEGPLLPLDPRDERAMRWWMQNTQPLIDIGCDEFWLDRGSANDNVTTRRAIVQMARRVRVLQGVKIGIEAIPFQLGKGGEILCSLGPDWDYITKVPAMGRWRQLWHSWIKHGYWSSLRIPGELRGPEGIECHVFITASDDPPPTTGDIAQLQAYGWIISYLNVIHDPVDGPVTEPE